MRPGKPYPIARLEPLAALGIAALLVLAGCAKAPSGGEEAESLRSASEEEAWEAWAEETGAGGSTSEAERTEAMEAQAAEMQRNFEESMAGATTDEDRVRAYQEFEAERAELNRMAEEDAAAGDEYSAPPP